MFSPLGMPVRRPPTSVRGFCGGKTLLLRSVFRVLSAVLTAGFPRPTSLGILRGLIAAYEAPEGRRATHKLLPGGWPEYRRTVEHVFAPLLAEPLEKITEGRLQGVLDDHPSRGSAARAWAYLRPILKSAKKLTAGAWRLVDIEDVHVHHQTQILDRVLSESELRRLLPVLRELVSDPHAAALHMLLPTGCRAEELLGSNRHPSRGMQRQHVEPDGAWTIPATKTGKGFVIPLSFRACEIVASQIERHQHPRVFCDPRGGRTSRQLGTPYCADRQGSEH